MRIFIQYENHILPLNVQIHDVIGQVYERILSEIGITADKIVNMYYDNYVFGLSPLNFEASVNEAKLKDRAFVFVILNHYPQLTNLTCKTYHVQYLQWKNRHMIPWDPSRLDYDPVLNGLNRRSETTAVPPTPVRSLSNALPPTPVRSLSNALTRQLPHLLPTHAPVSSPTQANIYFPNPSATSSSLQSQPNISLSRSRDSFPVNLRSPAQHVRVDRPPIRQDMSLESPRLIPNSLLSILSATDNQLLNNPVRYASQVRTPDTPHSPRLIENSLMRLPTRRVSDLDSILSITDRLLSNQPSDAEYRIFSRLIDVPVRLTEQEFAQLEKKSFRLVRQEYSESHPNEVAYDHCSIEREQFADDELVVILACGHYFKERGIREWLTQQSTRCPCCNADVRDSLASNHPSRRNQEVDEDDHNDDVSVGSQISADLTEDEQELENSGTESEDGDVHRHSLIESDSRRSEPLLPMVSRVRDVDSELFMLDIFALITQNEMQQSNEISQVINEALSSGLLSLDDTNTLTRMMRQSINAAINHQQPQILLPNHPPQSSLPVSNPLPSISNPLPSISNPLPSISNPLPSISNPLPSSRGSNSTPSSSGQ